MAIAYLRGAFSKIDVYPSRAVLHTSLTVLLVCGYLLVVGLLAQFVARRGGSRSFQLQAFLLLIGVALLSVLLLSDKLRQRIQAFVGRHFKRPQHDFRRDLDALYRGDGRSAGSIDPLCCGSEAPV